MRLELIHSLRYLIIAFLSYIITVTFAGWFESFVALQVGDETPADSGFLTLNPLDHFNVIGFAVVLWGLFYTQFSTFQFMPGWGRHIPLMPDTLRGKHLRKRIFIEYIGRSFGHLIILISTAIVMIQIAGVFNIEAMMVMMNASTSSFTESMMVLFLFLFQQNFVLFVIHFVLGIFKTLLYFHGPQFQEMTIQTMLFGFIGFMIGFILLSPILETFVLVLIKYIQSIMLYLR